MTLWPSLCEACRHRRVIVSAKGSRFLLCRRSAGDSRWPKYPPQPLLRCEGFEPPEAAPESDADSDLSSG